MVAIFKSYVVNVREKPNLKKVMLKYPHTKIKDSKSSCIFLLYLSKQVNFIRTKMLSTQNLKSNT